MNQPNAKQNVESPAAKIKWAKIADYTGYDSTSGMNGGKYGFWKVYEYTGEGDYHVTHCTTASGFSWCEYCGSFSDGCCDGPQYISESKLWQIIKAAENNDSDDVWAEYKLFDCAEWREKLRRRVRDSLNKTTDEKAIISCACTLNVSLE